MMRYLEDGRPLIDNNLAENCHSTDYPRQKELPLLRKS